MYAPQSGILDDLKGAAVNWVTSTVGGSADKLVTGLASKAGAAAAAGATTQARQAADTYLSDKMSAALPYVIGGGILLAVILLKKKGK